MPNNEPHLRYYKDLAAALRGRRLSEPQVVETLREVRSETQLSGQAPKGIFGDPRAYAATFEKGTSRSTGNWILTVVVLISALALGVRVFARLVLRVDDGSWITLAILIAAVVGVAIAAFVSGQLDRRIPKEISE